MEYLTSPTAVPTRIFVLPAAVPEWNIFNARQQYPIMHRHHGFTGQINQNRSHVKMVLISLHWAISINQYRLSVLFGYFLYSHVCVVCAYIHQIYYISFQNRLGTENQESVKCDIFAQENRNDIPFFILGIGTSILYIHSLSGCCWKTNENNFWVIVLNVQHHRVIIILIWAQCVPVHHPDVTNNHTYLENNACEFPS
jgi:hypothetical protein